MSRSRVAWCLRVADGNGGRREVFVGTRAECVSEMARMLRGTECLPMALEPHDEQAAQALWADQRWGHVAQEAGAGVSDHADELLAREQADKIVRLTHELNGAIGQLIGAYPHWRVSIFDVSGDPPQIKTAVWRHLE